MNQLELTKQNAIEHTKTKIIEDMNNYLGTKEYSPSFAEYLSDRGHYLEQIWLNIWLNKATNNISRQDKKEYLADKGFETENVSRKVINHLFRTEIRQYQPFDAFAWLKHQFEHNAAAWSDQYKKARTAFLKREEEDKLLQKQEKMYKKIEQSAEEIVNHHDRLLYLYVRYFIAKQLLSDFTNKPRFSLIDTFALEEKLEEIGRFNAEDYSTLADFFIELTGDIHKTNHWGRTYFEYETYADFYEMLVSDYLANIIIDFIMDHLPSELLHEYAETFSENLTKSALAEELELPIQELAEHFFNDLYEEYVSDLIRLSQIPFDRNEHQKIYEEDLGDRERKKAEELAELERKKAEEERMLEDIFGQEYRPSVTGNMKYILHIGETNTGKTHHALERMKAAKSGMYLAPLRLLALEVFDKLNAEGTLCSLKTGEEEKPVSGASHISCTVEMFHEKDFYDCIVIDEAQMITDKDRGFSWYKAITKANAHEVHIIGSLNAEQMILQLLGDSHIEVRKYTRDIPLQVERKEFNFSQVKKGDALICFSRKRVLETASRLENSGYSVSMIYGSMPPETRKKQVQRFNKGETSVIVSTDAIGMGLNLPIRRIVFLENEKFDGTRKRLLTSQEVKQIAGRAGRKGIYDVGKVAFSKDVSKMKRLLKKEDEQVHTFAIAPTNTVFEKFQKYFRDLGTFFELWEKFESPKGTKKATLTEERELYERIRGSEIEARFPLLDLYGFLHLPFSKKEPDLVWQWEQTMYAILMDASLPEPYIKKRNLEELELSYKAIGLHLLFLYRLGKQTEAAYWEHVREEISDLVHERLKTDVKNMAKKCRKCGRKLSWEHPFQICNACYENQYGREY